MSRRSFVLPASRRRVYALWCLLVWSPLVTTGAVAQQPSMGTSDSPAPIQWWHGALVAGGVTALMLLDHPVQRFTQSHRSGGLDDVAGAVRHFGQPEGFGVVALGLVGAGLIGGHPNLTRAGGRIVASVAVASAFTSASKLALGRPRPEESLDADGFVPFSGQESMPSGHTTVAFAFATSLADDIRQPWASAGLYTLATAVGWSRVNDNRHWLSDLAAGAAVGITSSKIVSGRWRIFHLRPPSILLDPHGAGLVWGTTF